MMPDLSKRSDEIEIMDDLAASGQIIDVTLRELETINLLLGGNYVTIDGVKKLIANSPRRNKWVIADVGCGSGDILKIIRRSLNKNKINADLIGIDANPNIIDYARRNSTNTENIMFETLDIFSSEFAARQFDILTGTLFFHHFSDEQLVLFFSQLKTQLTTGFVINDIHRHWFAFHSIKWLTRLFSRSPMVVNDAPVSVARAFTKKEIINILTRSGIKHYTIRWMWAFRWQVVVYPR